MKLSCIAVDDEPLALNILEDYISKVPFMDLVKSTKKQLNEQFLDTYIRDNISIPESQASGKDIFCYDPNSNGAIDYFKLTRELINKRFAKNLMEQLMRV